MKKDEIREAFDRAAFDYDGFIPRFIPYYYEQHNLMIDLITCDLFALESYFFLTLQSAEFCRGF